MYAKFAAASILVFGGASYVTYKYQEQQRFKELIFDALPDKKGFLLNIHQRAAYGYDNTFDSYEQTSKIGAYRKFIVQQCRGKILETGVGTSRNIMYYPAGSKVTAVDWSSNALEVAMLKATTSIDMQYRLEDVENLSFDDNTFDTVLDTFGLEYYLNPEQALQEMKRVCKQVNFIQNEGGQILLLCSGKSDYDLLNLYMEFKLPRYLQQLGQFPNRDWETMVKNLGLNVVQKERKINGTIYFYMIENNK